MNNQDSVDKRIVRLLGQDAHQNSEELARQLKVSSATVRRRTRKLTKSGVLRFVGLVDPRKFGYMVMAIIALDVTHGKEENVLNSLAEYGNIKWVSTTTGRYDVIASAWFTTTDALSEFVTSALAKIDGIKDTETFICLNAKKGRQVPFTLP